MRCSNLTNHEERIALKELFGATFILFFSLVGTEEGPKTARFYILVDAHEKLLVLDKLLFVAFTITTPTTMWVPPVLVVPSAATLFPVLVGAAFRTAVSEGTTAVVVLAA
jgi:hypothetical protein